MERFKKILFFADGAKGEKAALGNAVDLAVHNGAELVVLDVVAKIGTNDEKLLKSIEKLQQSIVNERLVVIKKMVSSVLPKQNKPKVTTRVVPGDKDYIEVIRTVVSEGYDLLVKSVDNSGVLSTTLFGDKDLHLLRQCPCPVWIIKPGRRKVSTVLGAVDLTSDEPATRQLCERILRISSGVAAVEGAKLHVLTAWQNPVDSSIKKLMDPKTYTDFVDSHKEKIRDRFDRLVAKFSLEGLNTHIVKGKPGDVISRHVSDYDVDLLVMGTLSRTGINGLLIGNTAERVLNVVNCSVLTLKPKGFKTSIK